MKDIKNLNIWKPETPKYDGRNDFMQVDITELNLSVRSYNCLKRAGCHVIGDILPYLGVEGQGLRRIRNLGARSEVEIVERIKELEAIYAKMPPKAVEPPVRRLIKPSRDIWNMDISEVHLSNRSYQKLTSCGIQRIGDIYATNPGTEPGWYAVRELFDCIMEMRKL